MRTIKIEYSTDKSEGTFFADVPVDVNVFLDQINPQIKKFLEERFGSIVSFKIDKFY